MYLCVHDMQLLSLFFSFSYPIKVPSYSKNGYTPTHFFSRHLLLKRKTATYSDPVSSILFYIFMKHLK